MSRKKKGGGLAWVALVTALLAGIPVGHVILHRPADMAQVVSYAQAQIGKPYLWGGTGPGSFDCSGLVMRAYRKIDVTFASSRPTAAVEWAYGPKTSHPVYGDLVFFAGADGSASSPGHVGIFLGPHEMIDAYGSGTVIRRESFGYPWSAPGLQYPVGYTDPR